MPETAVDMIGSSGRLRLVRASAGTGKTYALTTRYLALLRAGAEPTTVLATTFTRKAAGEVFGRVLTRLADAVLDDEARSGLDRAIRDEGLLNAGVPALTADDCAAMLRGLVAGMDRVAISTIDSFFGRVCGAFALELGLPAEPVLTDDGSALAAELRGAAIEAMLGRAVDDNMDALLTLLRQLHHDSAKRSVTASLDDIFSGGPGGMFGTFRQAREAEKWPTLATPARMTTTELDTHIAVLSESESLLPKSKNGKINGHWAKALRGDLAKAWARDWKGLMKSGLSPNALTGVPYQRHLMPDALRSLYRPLADHALAELLDEYNARLRSTWELLDRFAGRFEERCRSQRVMLFADLTDALARRLQGLDAAWRDELAYRMDGRVEHLLIDEFQDTSVDQFAVLWPLMDEASADASSSRTLFCVGDEKQSIYGWRGGRVELFDRVADVLTPRGLEVDTLSRSYRSSPAVLESVNAVFSRAKNSGSWTKNDGAAVSAFVGAYGTHEAARDLPGFVALRTTGPLAGDEVGPGELDDELGGSAEVMDEHHRFVVGRVAELRRLHPAASVGVLTRTNRQAGSVLHALRTGGVNASGEGGAALTDHPAVGAVLAALRLADHPGDQVAAYHVSRSPMGAVVGLEGRSPARCRAVSARLRRALLDRGYADVLAQWVTALAPACDATGLRRLRQLARLAEVYQPVEPLRAGAFVRHVERSRVEDLAGDGVRVMTIHRAKGLEFDLVVLPALHGSLSFRSTLLEDRHDPAGPIDQVRLAGDQALRDDVPVLSDLYDKERQRWAYEQLCALYVAMTRARYGLEMLIPCRGSDTKPGGYGLSFASLLVDTLAPGEGVSMPDRVLYEGEAGGGLAGVEAWEGASESVVAEGVEGSPDAVESAPWPLRRAGRGAVRWSAASAAGSAREKSVEGLLDPVERGAVAFGTAVHAFFERVGFLAESPGGAADGPAATSATELAARLKRMRESNPGVATHLASAWESAEVRGVFARRGAAGLRREHPVALRDGDRLVRGVIDRLVWWEDEAGKPSRAEVIDFKTDAAADEAELAERVGHHRAQLDLYRRAAAGLLGLALERVEAVLVFTAPGRVERW